MQEPHQWMSQLRRPQLPMWYLLLLRWHQRAVIPPAGLPQTVPIGQPQVALPVPAVISTTGDSNTSDTPVVTDPVVSQPTPQTDGTPGAQAPVSQPPGVKLIGQPQLGQMPSTVVKDGLSPRPSVVGIQRLASGTGPSRAKKARIVGRVLSQKNYEKEKR